MNDGWKPSFPGRPGIVLDVNAENQVVGIEVLDLRKQDPSANLKEMQFDVA